MGHFKTIGVETILVTAVLFISVLCPAAFPAGPDMREYLETPDEYGSVIPDFSHAGYMGGGVPLPDVPAVKELSPLPAGDDRERIQAALDGISEMAPGEDGFRGALLLRAGDYRVDGYLHIRESGVVLRGEGQFEGGTTITATRRDYVLPGRRRQHSLIYLGEHDTSRTGFLEKDFESAWDGITVPVGSNRIGVINPGGFSTGDDVLVGVYTNENWTEALGLKESWVSKTRDWTRFYYERRIAGIDGSTLVLDAPLTFYLEDENYYRAAVWSYSNDARISRSGVENLRLKSYFTDENYNDLENFSGVETHAWSGVRVEPVRDCWVRNVTALYFQHAAVQVEGGARNVTVQDCAYIRPVSRIAGNKRYSFRVEGSRVLLQRCYSRGGRHAFGSSSAGQGLNVFLDCLAEKNHGDIGPHIKWSVGYLYDNIDAPQGRIEVQNVGGSHGWRGVNHVLWNCKTARMICDKPETRDTNWAVGCISCRYPGRVKQQTGRWISHLTHVEPRSLYLYQLEERLGEGAVRNVTIGMQREGNRERIFDYLKDKYSELTEWEKANDENLIRDPGFRILTARNPWMLRVSDEPISELERAVNPVFGDDTAVVIPAGDQLRYRFNTITVYPFFSPKEYELEFDYKMSGENAIWARVYHVVSPPWEHVERFGGHREQGDGGWKKYSFRFSFEPEFYEADGTPKLSIIHIRFKSDGEVSIANPSLRILSGKYSQEPKP